MAALCSALCSTTSRQMDLLLVVFSYSRDYKLDADFLVHIECSSTFIHNKIVYG